MHIPLTTKTQKTITTKRIVRLTWSVTIDSNSIEWEKVWVERVREHFYLRREWESFEYKGNFDDGRVGDNFDDDGKWKESARDNSNGDNEWKAMIEREYGLQ